MSKGRHQERNQRADVLAYIIKHGSITQLEAYREFPAPITRLSAVIFDLKKDGHIIDSEWCKTKNCYGKIEFKKYKLIKLAE